MKVQIFHSNASYIQTFHSLKSLLSPTSYECLFCSVLVGKRRKLPINNFFTLTTSSLKLKCAEFLCGLKLPCWHEFLLVEKLDSPTEKLVQSMFYFHPIYLCFQVESMDHGGEQGGGGQAVFIQTLAFLLRPLSWHSRDLDTEGHSKIIIKRKKHRVVWQKQRLSQSRTFSKPTL